MKLFTDLFISTSTGFQVQGANYNPISYFKSAVLKSMADLYSLEFFKK